MIRNNYKGIQDMLLKGEITPEYEINRDAKNFLKDLKKFKRDDLDKRDYTYIVRNNGAGDYGIDKNSIKDRAFKIKLSDPDPTTYKLDDLDDLVGVDIAELDLREKDLINELDRLDRLDSLDDLVDDKDTELFKFDTRVEDLINEFDGMQNIVTGVNCSGDVISINSLELFHKIKFVRESELERNKSINRDMNNVMLKFRESISVLKDTEAYDYLLCIKEDLGRAVESTVKELDEENIYDMAIGELINEEISLTEKMLNVLRRTEDISRDNEVFSLDLNINNALTTLRTLNSYGKDSKVKVHINKGINSHFNDMYKKDNDR